MVAKTCCFSCMFLDHVLAMRCLFFGYLYYKYSFGHSSVIFGEFVGHALAIFGYVLINVLNFVATFCYLSCLGIFEHFVCARLRPAAGLSAKQTICRAGVPNPWDPQFAVNIGSRGFS